MANVLDVPDFGVQLATMIGIGVGIDYALFIVTRYRVGAGPGTTPREAVVVAMATAGRAVVFAGVDGGDLAARPGAHGPRTCAVSPSPRR